MKVYFKKNQTKDVIKNLKSILSKKESQNWADIQVEQDKHTVTISISKLGTSKLFFSCEDCLLDGCCWQLIDMKVAFTHRVYKKKFKKKAEGFFSKIGGSFEQQTS